MSPILILVSTWRQLPTTVQGGESQAEHSGLAELRKRRLGRLSSLEVTDHNSKEEGPMQKQSCMNLPGGLPCILLIITLCMHGVKLHEAEEKYNWGLVNSRGQGDV